MRIRAAVRVLIPVLSLGGMLALTAPATRADAPTPPPDQYQVVAGSTGEDQRGYQTGSPVDPQPAENTSAPNTSITADSSPSTGAHAAFLEPPASAQALTNLNNVPAPYPTDANAQCSGCQSPQSQDADGNSTQNFDSGRVGTSGGAAHAVADLYAATATATNNSQSFAPDDHVAPLFAAAESHLPVPFSLPSNKNKGRRRRMRASSW